MQDAVAAPAARRPIHFIVTLLAVFAAGSVGFALTSVGSRATLPWLASGVAIAALVRWGIGLWPALLIGGTLMDRVHGAPWLAALGAGTGLALAAATTAGLLRRCDFHSQFDRHQDVPAFIAAVVLGMLWIATLGVGGYTLAGVYARGDTVNSWLAWWLNNVTGAFLLAPPLLAMRAATWRELASQGRAALGWLAAVAAGSGLMFSSIAAAPGPRMTLLLASVVLIVWSAIRLGLVATAVASLALASAAGASYAFRIGALAEYDAVSGLQVLWGYVAVLTLCGLMTTALLAERDRLTRQLRASERRYQTLFDSNPVPVLVYDRDTLRIVMVNDAAVRKYGHSRSQFLGLTIDDLWQPGEPRPLLSGTTGDGGEGVIEARLRTRDGRVLQVETTQRSIDFDGRRAELMFAFDVTERRRLQRAVLDAASEEQRRLGQELHDGLGQELTGLAMFARSLAVQSKQAGWSIGPDLLRLAEIASQAIKSCRAIARGLSPLSETRGGLIEALRDLTERIATPGGCTIRFSVDERAPLAIPWEARNHLFRIGQETLSNALKHGQPSTIEVRLEVGPERVRLSVSDDGRGIDPSAPAAGLGLDTMRYRAASIGGDLRIVAGAGGGTTVICECPQPVPAARSA
jgi:two-component system, LuxR family, sensor kinase FixL